MKEIINKNLKHSSVNPFAVTEQGVSTLSAVLKSETAFEILAKLKEIR